MRTRAAIVALVCLILSLPAVAGAQVYSIPLGTSPYRGPAHAKVTIVFACQYGGPFCNRVRPTIDQMFRHYGGSIKLVYKHLPVHVRRATPSHMAACAAHLQGQFRVMHRALWTQLYPQRAFAAAAVRALAVKLGLNMRRYDNDIKNVCPPIVSRDRRALNRVGGRGTPSFFINGHMLSGAMPFASFKAVIDKELALADRRIRTGTRLRNYYRKWVLNRGLKRKVRRRRARVAPSPRRPLRRPRPKPKVVYSVPVGNSPFAGRANAKVTIVVSYDFNSPHSKRIRATLERLAKRYGSDLRIAFKSFVVYTLYSRLPALAVCAAHRQGRFFAMEREIWKLPYRTQTRRSLETIGRSLGLNMRRYRRDVNSACTRIIAADHALLSRVGVSGVPASFVNGRFLAGNQPFNNFKRLIDEELRKANRRIRTGRASKHNYYRNYVVRYGKKAP